MLLRAPCSHTVPVVRADAQAAADHVIWLDPCPVCHYVFGLRLIPAEKASPVESWHIRTGPLRLEDLAG